MDISPSFSGGAVRFSVTGEGVRINSKTGIATFYNAAPGAGVTPKVVAENSGGRMEIDLRLCVATVEALSISDWQIARATTRAASGSFGPSCFSFGSQRPTFDIRRTEFLQFIQAGRAFAAPLAAD